MKRKGKKEEQEEHVNNCNLRMQVGSLSQLFASV